MTKEVVMTLSEPLLNGFIFIYVRTQNRALRRCLQMLFSFRLVCLHAVCCSWPADDVAVSKDSLP